MNKEGKLRFWRLLKIDKMIREGQFPTVPMLSKEFEVSTRTVELVEAVKSEIKKMQAMY